MHQDTLHNLINLVKELSLHVCSDHEIKLSEFGHYIALIAVAAFAYTSAKTVKEFVIKITLSKNDNYKDRIKDMQMFKAEISLVESTTELNTEVEAIIPNYQKKFKTCVKEGKEIYATLERIDKRYNAIRNGDSFNSMLYFLGAAYLSFLIVMGFEKQEYAGNIYVYLILVLILAAIQQIYVTVLNFIGYKGWKYADYIVMLSSTYFWVAVYCFTFIVLFPISFMYPCRYLADWLFNEHLCHKIMLNSNFSLCRILFNKYCIIVPILSMPFVPYLTLFLRKYFFLGVYDKSFEKHLVQYERRIDYIKLISTLLMAKTVTSIVPTLATPPPPVDTPATDSDRS